MKIYVQLKNISFVIIILLLLFSCNENEALKNMVLIDGGEYNMGDVFKEGKEDEFPIHKVKVDDFFMSKYEVTVGEFQKFVNETSYKTNSEGKPYSEELQLLLRELYPLMQEREKNRDRIDELSGKILEFGGTGRWDPDKKIWNMVDSYQKCTTSLIMARFYLKMG